MRGRVAFKLASAYEVKMSRTLLARKSAAPARKAREVARLAAKADLAQPSQAAQRRPKPQAPERLAKSVTVE